MPEASQCPECGSPLPANWPKGLCSRCALQGALELTHAESQALQPEGSDAPSANPPFAAVPLATLKYFGDYELLEEIARGGMGIVYKARQVSLDRLVAVKLLLRGDYASDDFIKRFHIEASAAAALQHPNIVAIHEVGVHQGQHYFAMDLVEGPNLAQLLRDGPPPAKRAAGYVKTIAEAIHYAHTRRILHRDLKPSNVLIDADDQPRVTDFGLAKNLANNSELTVSGQVIGSPSFMPPEQAAGETREVGVVSDVYGLGAILYYLLTGRPPFAAETMHETLLQVLHSEPIAPRLLNPGLPRDLETVCLKCLQKQPRHRYQTARELAEELGCVLRGEPVCARPIGSAERLWRWCWRNPTLSSLGAFTALLLLVVAVGSVIAAFRIDRERSSAEANLARQYSANAARAVDEDEASAALVWYAAALQFEPSDPMRAQAYRVAFQTTLRQFPRLIEFWPIPASAHAAEPRAFTFSSDGRRALISSSTNSVRVWDVPGGKPLTPAFSHSALIEQASLSSDGQLVATGSYDETARVWAVTNGMALTPTLSHPYFVTHAEFSRDTRRLVTADVVRTNDPIQIWDVATGKLLAKPMVGTNAPLYDSIRISADGQRLLAVSEPYDAVRVWSMETGQQISPAFAPDERPLPYRGGTDLGGLRFSPDGQKVLLFRGGEGRLWDVLTGEPASPPMRDEGTKGVQHAEFSPDGLRIVTASVDDRGARVWDTTTGRPRTPLIRHKHGMKHAAFSPDGRRIVTISANGEARLWHADTGLSVTAAFTHDTAIIEAKFSPDAAQLITCSSDAVRVWDLTRPTASDPTSLPARATLIERVFHSVRSAAFSPDGLKMLTMNGERPEMARIRSVHSGQALTGPLADMSGRGPDSAVFSSDGRWIATATSKLRVWNADSGLPVTPPLDWPGSDHGGAGRGCLEFSPDGNYLLAAGGGPVGRVWDAATGEVLIATLGKPDPTDVLFATFSPDSRRVAALTYEGAQIWDVSTRAPSGPVFAGDFSTGGYATFTPDGRHLLVAGRRGLGLWDAATGTKVWRSRYLDHWVNHAAFSRDGRYLATGCSDRTARVWEAFSGRPVTTELLHDSAVTDVAFSPDGRLLLTKSDHLIRIWGVASGQLVTRPFGANTYRIGDVLREESSGQKSTSNASVARVFYQQAKLVTCEFSADSRIARTIDDAGAVQFWDVTPERRPVEDITRVTQVLVSRRIDATGGMTPLTVTGSESLFQESVRRVNEVVERVHARLPVQATPTAARLLESWRQLRAKYPEEFSVTTEAKAAWHLREAALCEQNLQWFGARFHWDHLIKPRPDDPEPRKRRAGADAELLLWTGQTNGAIAALNELASDADILPANARSELLLKRSDLRKRLGQIVEAQSDWLAAHQIPSRPRDAGANLIDLSSHFNDTLDNSWQPGVPKGNHLASLARGCQVLSEVEFDVRGIVQLSSSRLAGFGVALPEQVRGIKIGRTCRRLHFLHATDPDESDGKQVGAYVLHYSDGQRRELPVIYGEHLRNWWVTAAEEKQPTASSCAWRGTNAVQQVVQLFKSTRENPLPDIKLETIHYVSAMTTCAPFLIAITLE